jgi:hypothetical protein
LLFFLVGFRRGSVLCLRHPGMIAPIPLGEQPLGLEAGGQDLPPIGHPPQA